MAYGNIENAEYYRQCCHVDTFCLFSKIAEFTSRNSIISADISIAYNERPVDAAINGITVLSASIMNSMALFMIKSTSQCFFSLPARPSLFRGYMLSSGNTSFYDSCGISESYCILALSSKIARGAEYHGCAKNVRNGNDHCRGVYFTFVDNAVYGQRGCYRTYEHLVV